MSMKESRSDIRTEVRYKAYFLVKPFRQRTNEQNRSRKRADQTNQDKFVKTAEISKEFLLASGENSFVPREVFTSLSS